MAAKNFNDATTGRKNYYNVAYGALSTRVKEVPEGATEITAEELKSLNAKRAEIDLRNKYVTKTGDYPFAVFYQGIEGKIVAISKKEPEGIDKMLELEIIDSDGDHSHVSMSFYSKYAENLLNRLAGVKNIEDVEFTLAPYAIPNSFKDEKTNKTIEFYNQGFSVRAEGVKLEVAFKNDNKDLPPTERLQDAKGNDVTSRVKRVNFLYDNVLSKFNKPADASQGVSNDFDDDEDSLPF